MMTENAGSAAIIYRGVEWFCDCIRTDMRKTLAAGDFNSPPYYSVSVMLHAARPVEVKSIESTACFEFADCTLGNTYVSPGRPKSRARYVDSYLFIDVLLYAAVAREHMWMFYYKWNSCGLATQQ
jgi:hypothetical protein